ncbi:MAG: hypothetical protein LBJ93_02695 [Clostridiales bacterium]|jgi:hypothetical protein|nr:hypothetical protein [Clostridiales bacterium]
MCEKNDTSEDKTFYISIGVGLLTIASAFTGLCLIGKSLAYICDSWPDFGKLFGIGSACLLPFIIMIIATRLNDYLSEKKRTIKTKETEINQTDRQ